MEECFPWLIHLADFYNTIVQAVFVILNFVLMLFSVPGNAIVIYVVWTRPRLRVPTPMLISSLALCDVITALAGQLSYVINITFMNNSSCMTGNMTAFFNASSCSTSLLVLSLIAYDRYLHVSKGLRYHEVTSAKRTVISTIICCIVGVCTASLFASKKKIVLIVGMLTFAVVGSTSFTFICVYSRKISQTVQAHYKETQQRQENCSSSAESSEAARRMERNVRIERAVNCSVFRVIVLFFISWSPCIIILSTYTVKLLTGEPIPTQLRLSFAWAATVTYVNGAVNPFIYAYRSDLIGKEIRKFLRRESTEIVPMSMVGDRRTVANTASTAALAACAN